VAPGADRLPEQILPDGGHFERSPMYHATLLEDLLDLVQLGARWPALVGEPELAGWRATAQRMLRWLGRRNGWRRCAARRRRRRWTFLGTGRRGGWWKSSEAWPLDRYRVLDEPVDLTDPRGHDGSAVKIGSARGYG
jgi:hypothetical protein